MPRLYTYFCATCVAAAATDVPTLLTPMIVARPTKATNRRSRSPIERWCVAMFERRSVFVVCCVEVFMTRPLCERQARFWRWNSAYLDVNCQPVCRRTRCRGPAAVAPVSRSLRVSALERCDVDFHHLHHRVHH